MAGGSAEALAGTVEDDVDGFENDMFVTWL